MIEVLGGFGWLVLAGACFSIFGALIWASLFDANTNTQILKTPKDGQERSRSMTMLTWAVMTALYGFFLYFAWMGSSLLTKGLV